MANRNYDPGDLACGPAAALRNLLRVKKERRVRYVGIPSAERFSEETPFTRDECFVLKKPKNRDFVILNITDPHFADYDYRFLTAFAASRTVRRLVRDVKPDLITVTGDNICTDAARFSLKRFCALMESFNVPWAPVFGNHDNETNCDLNFQADAFLRCPHCLFKKGDPAMGCGNYTILIEERQPDGSALPVQALVMAYHRDGFPTETQLKWFSRVCGGVKSLLGAPPVAVFCHIPLPEYQNAFNAARDVKRRTWRPGFGACGEIHETICCERRDGRPVQRGFFPAILRAGNVTQVFCGHEHLNDFSIVYKGVRLTYTLKVGLGSGARPSLNGGTVIRVGPAGVRRITQRAVRGPFIFDKEDIRVP